VKEGHQYLGQTATLDIFKFKRSGLLLFAPLRSTPQLMRSRKPSDSPKDSGTILFARFDCIGPFCDRGRCLDAAREHETGRQADSKCSIGELTPRERQITLLVSDGLTDKLVAERLNLAESTVKSHLHHIYNKLGIPNRTALSVLTHCAAARAS
jgi:DNA-binding CsgD family transcriptional regulator